MKLPAVLLAGLSMLAPQPSLPIGTPVHSDQNGEARMAQSSKPSCIHETMGREEPITIIGEVVDGGVECPLFRTDDGREFTLESHSKIAAPVGTKMTLRGRPMAITRCRQGIGFRTLERLR